MLSSLRERLGRPALGDAWRLPPIPRPSRGDYPLPYWILGRLYGGFLRFCEEKWKIVAIWTRSRDFRRVHMAIGTRSTGFRLVPMAIGRGRTDFCRVHMAIGRGRKSLDRVPMAIGRGRTDFCRVHMGGGRGGISADPDTTLIERDRGEFGLASRSGVEGALHQHHLGRRLARSRDVDRVVDQEPGAAQAGRQAELHRRPRRDVLARSQRDPKLCRLISGD